MSEEPVAVTKEEKVLVPVSLLSYKEKTALVEYEDSGKKYRVYVPRKFVSADSKVERAVLRKGVRHGLPWEEVELPTVTGEQLAAELHRHNVWTAEDFRSNPNGVRAAINNLYGKPLALLTQFLNSQKS